jgi:hypothetical protein
VAGHPADGYAVANQGFATTYEGEPIFIQKGEFVPKDHPFVAERQDLFDQATHFGRFDEPEATPQKHADAGEDDDELEQATAGPGEKRGAKKR